MDNKTVETPTVFTITKHYRITFTIALGIVMCSGLYAAVSMVANYEQWNIARYTAAIIAAMASAVSLLACIILIRLWVLKSYVVILDEVCIRIPIIIGWRKIAWEKVCAVEAFEIHGDMVVVLKYPATAAIIRYSVWLVVVIMRFCRQLSTNHRIWSLIL